MFNIEHEFWHIQPLVSSCSKIEHGIWNYSTAVIFMFNIEHGFCHPQPLRFSCSKIEHGIWHSSTAVIFMFNIEHGFCHPQPLRFSCSKIEHGIWNYSTAVIFMFNIDHENCLYISNSLISISEFLSISKITNKTGNNIFTIEINMELKTTALIKYF